MSVSVSNNVVVDMNVATVTNMDGTMTLFTAVETLVAVVVSIVRCIRCRCVSYREFIEGRFSRYDRDTIYIYIYIYICRSVIATGVVM